MTIQNTNLTNEDCTAIKKYFEKTPTENEVKNLNGIYYFSNFPTLICLKINNKPRYIHVNQDKLKLITETFFKYILTNPEKEVLETIALDLKSFTQNHIYCNSRDIDHVLESTKKYASECFKVPPLENSAIRIAVNFPKN